MSHPAKYSKELIPYFLDALSELQDGSVVFDPMAGENGIRFVAPRLVPVGNELEQEWASVNPAMMVQGDALRPAFRPGFADAIVVSPTYGNRMADSHNAQDDSKRNTYTHRLGRKLRPSNSGQMNWGNKYRDFHEKAWPAVLECLRPDGIFILNVSNHIRKGVEVDVTGWHVDLLESLGLTLQSQTDIVTRRQKQGANRDLRVPFEHVIVFEKPLDH